jgi:hypothetical protein
VAHKYTSTLENHRVSEMHISMQGAALALEYRAAAIAAAAQYNEI